VLIRTYYEVLGVAPNASAAAIRAAYRDQARRLHPDRVQSGSSDADLMSAVNEANRVLSDPGRRAVYDRTLAPASDSEIDDDVVQQPPDAPFRHSALSPAGPAKIPWKLMAVVASLGSFVVLVSAATDDPPSVEAPDGIIRAGSCVEIESNGDAREVACTGATDTVVDLLIPTGATCPAQTVAHRDRLGLGVACIRE
jgi:molecular chaperone DnaJ